jgi:low affinity Fe/Cu permease
MEDHAAHDGRTRTPRFSRLAHRLTDFTGSGLAVALVVVAFVVWLGLGVATGYPRWWELVVTTGMPFLTLLMLVVIQHTQNHDDRATQLKLDELIRASEQATNRMMTVEDASGEDLDRIRADFRGRSQSAALGE